LTRNSEPRPKYVPSARFAFLHLGPESERPQRCTVRCCFHSCLFEIIWTRPTFSWRPRWHRDVIYAPPLVISSSCRRTVWTHVVFGRF